MSDQEEKDCLLDPEDLQAIEARHQELEGAAQRYQWSDVIITHETEAGRLKSLGYKVGEHFGIVRYVGVPEPSGAGFLIHLASGLALGAMNPDRFHLSLRACSPELLAAMAQSFAELVPEILSESNVFEIRKVLRSMPYQALMARAEILLEGDVVESLCVSDKNAGGDE